MKKFFLISLLPVLFSFLCQAETPQDSKSPLRKELVKINYVQWHEIQNLLEAYLSKEGRLFWSQGQGYISISDHTENVEKILAVIKEVDVRPVDLQFFIELILGSESGEEKIDASLKDDPIVKELKSLLRYKNFSLLDSSMVRAVPREGSRITLGRDGELRLELRPVYIKEEKEEIIQLEAHLSKRGDVILQVGEGGQQSREWMTLLTSNLTMKPGEKTVVGVSKMDGGDKGLILIISGKVVK